MGELAVGGIHAFGPMFFCFPFRHFATSNIVQSVSSNWSTLRILGLSMAGVRTLKTGSIGAGPDS